MAKLRIIETPEAIGDDVAGHIWRDILAAQNAGRRYLLGCPTGRTPRPVYQALSRFQEREKADLSHVIIVLMDEFLVKNDGKWGWPPLDAHFGCRRFAYHEILEPLGGAIRQENLWAPHPDDPNAYEAQIRGAGGIDFFILASGASDGHVAFNPPGAARDSRTRIIELAEATRRDNMKSFPQFQTLEDVPTHGVSVGIATIADAKAGAMLLWEEGKQHALKRITSVSSYDPDWPATVVHEIGNAKILADKQAALNASQ